MPARQTPLALINGGFIASSCCLERRTEIVRSALEALKRTALIRKDMAEQIENRAK
jgi:hypothetical protein